MFSSLGLMGTPCSLGLVDYRLLDWFRLHVGPSLSLITSSIQKYTNLHSSNHRTMYRACVLLEREDTVK